MGVLLFFFVFWCCVCVYVFVSFALSGGFVFLWWVFWGCCWWGVACLGSVLGAFLGFWGWFLPVFGVVFWYNGFGVVFWVSGPVWKVAFALVSALCTGVHFLHFGGL